MRHRLLGAAGIGRTQGNLVLRSICLSIDVLWTPKPTFALLLKPARAHMTGTASPEAADSNFLPHRIDNYNGVIIDEDKLPNSQDNFRDRLNSSITGWRSEGRKGVWLKLVKGLSSLVPVAVEAGFTYHHAEADYLMLAMWLRSTPCTLPANASHQIGIGAFVLNSLGEMLVVKERSGPAANYAIWKIPTGIIDRGEDFKEAAVRETFEETVRSIQALHGSSCELQGLRVVFQNLIFMRQAHGFLFGISDLLMVCALSLDSSSAQESDVDGRPLLRPCKTEIADARWMPVAEYAELEFVQKHAQLLELVKCMKSYQNGCYQGFRTMKTEGIRGGQQLVAHGLVENTVDDCHGCEKSAASRL